MRTTSFTHIEVFGLRGEREERGIHKRIVDNRIGVLKFTGTRKGTKVGSPYPCANKANGFKPKVTKALEAHILTAEGYGKGALPRGCRQFFEREHARDAMGKVKTMQCRRRNQDGIIFTAIEFF
jgi:hypothetical protein